MRAALLVGAIATTAVIHSQMDTVSAVGGDESHYLPSPERAKLLALGFEPALADYYWVKALLAVGVSLDSEQDRGRIGDLIDLVTTLDPWVDHPYRFASLWLVESPEEVRRGKGMVR